MVKAVLIVWLGLGNNEILDITVFDSVAECEIVKTEMIDFSGRFDSEWVKCVPYEVK